MDVTIESLERRWIEMRSGLCRAMLLVDSISFMLSSSVAQQIFVSQETS
jgi:hypothetical protein